MRIASLTKVATHRLCRIERVSPPRLNEGIHAIALHHFFDGSINFPYFGDWYKPWAWLATVMTLLL